MSEIVSIPSNREDMHIAHTNANKLVYLYIFEILLYASTIEWPLLYIFLDLTNNLIVNECIIHTSAHALASSTH